MGLAACDADARDAQADATAARSGSSVPASVATGGAIAPEPSPDDIDCAALRDALAVVAAAWPRYAALVTTAGAADWAALGDPYELAGAVDRIATLDDESADPAIAAMTTAAALAARGATGDDGALTDLRAALGADEATAAALVEPLRDSVADAGC